MQRECSFNADAAGHFTNREGFSDAAALLRDDQTFERLDTGLVAFFDLDVNSDCAARTEFRNVGTELIFCDFVD